MLQRLNHRAGHYTLLLVVGASLFLINLGGPALWDIDEGRNTVAAMEMRESGDWIKPTFNGQLRSHKPALLYWLQVAAFHFFGMNEFAARLPSALAALVTLLLVYEVGRAMFNPLTGLFGGLILASSALFCASAHFANPDALLLTFTTLTLLLSWLGLDPGRGAKWCLPLAGVSAGFAVLAKGPVGVALPVAVVGLYLLWSGNWRLIFDRRWLQATLLCALVAMPWYVLVTVETKREFLREFMGTHNLDRALYPMENHSGPPYYYVMVVLVGLIPWSIFLGSSWWYGFWSAIRSPWCRVRSTWSASRDAEGGQADPAPAYRFLWCWIGVYFLVFTVAATKLPNYILPVYPACALLIARFLDRWARGVLVPPRWMQATSVAWLAFIGIVTIAGLLVAGGTIEVRWLRGRSWPGLETWAILGLVLLVGAAAAAWCLRHQQRAVFLVVIFASALGFVGPMAAGASLVLDRYRAPRPLVAEAGALQRDAEIRIGCYQLEHLPSLNFYVQRNVKHCQCDQEVLDFLHSPQAGYLFLPREDWDRLAGRVTAPHRVLGRHREMYRTGEVVVVANH
jgi:4-amino-4-deoxy-L-arabinose transferase-like glycosyltransferase